MSPAKLRYYLSSLGTLAGGVRNLSAVAWALLSARDARRRPFLVRLSGGYRFRVLRALDVWVLKEVVLDREYEQIGPVLEAGWTVVDIGAAYGEFTIPATRRGGGRTIAVEPAPATHALLLENLALNDCSDVTVLQLAVGARDGTAHLALAARGAMMNSTAAPAAGGDGVEVPMVTLSGLFERAGIAHCDYLKLDCEGAEYDILLPCPDATLHRITHLCLEFHEGVVAHTRQNLVTRLEAAGFAVRCTGNPAQPQMGWIYACREPSPA